MLRSGHLLTIFALLAILLVWPELAEACPTCKDGVAEQSGGEGEASQSLGYAFSYSVIFMISVPFVILVTGVTLVVRAVKSGAIPEL